MDHAPSFFLIIKNDYDILHRKNVDISLVRAAPTSLSSQQW